MVKSETGQKGFSRFLSQKKVEKGEKVIPFDDEARMCYTGLSRGQANEHDALPPTERTKLVTVAW